MFAALMNDILVSAATAKWGETVVFGEHKCLQDLYHCVMNTPSIKKWVEKRPQTDAWISKILIKKNFKAENISLYPLWFVCFLLYNSKT